MSDFNYDNLVGWLDASFAQNADEIALEFIDRSYTYKELDIESQHISNYILANFKDEQLIAVYGIKDFFTYACIIAIIKAGKAYVPINPKFPNERNLEILELSNVKILFGNTENTSLKVLAETSNNNLQIIDEQFEKLTSNKKNIKINSEDPAYLLFTSGSTGKPKGVLISHKQITTYLTNISYITTQEIGNKCSHTFDLTFDLSVHDIFCTLTDGAILCVPSENELLSPATYIKNRGITHWFSVPSLIKIMDKLHQLKENNFPTITQAIFCGEALSSELSNKFIKCISSPFVTNLYGPTECTIGICSYEVTENSLSKNGVACIGEIFERNGCLINFEDSNEKKGELLLSGDQVIKKYFKREELDKKYFYVDDNSRVWYKTGDIVELDDEGYLYYIGRKDTQIKLNGYRIELEEIESVIKLASNNLNVICYLKEENNLTILIAILEDYKTIEISELIKKCKLRLPAYMIPQQIVYLQRFPLNTNGKIDRKAVIEMAKDNSND